MLCCARPDAVSGSRSSQTSVAISTKAPAQVQPGHESRSLQPRNRTAPRVLRTRAQCEVHRIPIPRSRKAAAWLAHPWLTTGNLSIVNIHSKLYRHNQMMA